MAGNSKDSKILAYKDMINQLNKNDFRTDRTDPVFTKNIGSRPSGKRKSSSAD